MSKVQQTPELTADQARELLKYDPQTGRLYWLPRDRELFSRDQSWKTWNTRFAGHKAFTSVNVGGYRQGAIFGHMYVAHRVIWLLVNSEWPPADIDHVNGDRVDNRWSNLRSVTRSENGHNRKRTSRNTSGVNGVSWVKRARKWIAYIHIDGRSKSLGVFDSIEEAASARARANAQHGFSARHGVA